MLNHICPASFSILFFAATLILPMLRYFPVRQLDEGFYAYPAFLIFKGEHPYRDFYLGYTPGKTYLLASLFKLFGPSLLVARWYYALTTVVLSFEIVWLTYLIIPSIQVAWLAGALFIISLFPRREIYYITAVETGMFSDRTVISLLVMISFILATTSQNYLLFFSSGALLTLSLFFAQEAGIWVFAAIMVYFFADLPKEWLVTAAFFFTGSATLGALILACALKNRIPLKRVWNECIKEILALGTGEYRRPYPSLFSTLPFKWNRHGINDFCENRLHFFIHYCRYYMPMFFYTAALFLITSAAVNGGLGSVERGVILPLVYGIFASFFLYSWPDYSHIVRGLPVQLPVALFTLSSLFNLANPFSLYILLFFTALCVYDFFYFIQTCIVELRERKERILLNKSGKIYLEKSYHRKISSLVDLMDKETEPGEKIFVAPADPLLYFLMQKRSCTYLKSFLPFNPCHYHRQALSALKTHSVKWIVYNRAQDNRDFFPRGVTFSGFAPMLYKYIEANYSRVFRLEGYDVYKKN